MSEIKPEFGKLITEILEKHGLSLRGAYYRTSVHYTSISAMCKGAIPSKDLIMRFAEGLGEDPIPILVAAGKIASTDATEAIAMALRGVDSIPEQGKEQIRRFVEKINQKYNPEEKIGKQGEE